MSPEESGTELGCTEGSDHSGYERQTLHEAPLDMSLWHDAWSWMRVGSRDF